MRKTSFLLISVYLLSCASAFAQRAGVPGEDLANDLAGFIDVQIERNYTGSGLEPLTVELSRNGVPITRTFSSPNGTAQLGPLRSGRYTVTVSGPGVSSSIESVELRDGMNSHVMVGVRRDTDQSSTAANGPVSVAELNVPSKAQKIYGNGLKYARKQQWEKAAAEFKRAIEAYPSYVSAHTALGLACYELHDLPGADASFSKALQISSSDSMALRWLGKLRLADHRFSEADQYLENAIRYDPNNDEVLMMLSWAQLETGKTQTAIATALRVAETSVHAPAAHYIAGRGYDVSGQKDLAIAQYKLCIKSNPHSPNVQLAESRIAALMSR
jgi:Flp pilus assembly protein TadD